VKYVAYYRVSTARQGRSGLGLEAQRAAVLGFINGNGAEVIAEFTEVESGKRNDRPELEKALHRCKVTGATLVIAKLDRLSRNAAFLLTLRDSGAEFVAADMPDANSLTVGIMALMAQHEREMISKRTKEALAAAKARGTKLGNPHGAAHLRGRGNREAVEAVKARADEKARDVLPEIEGLQARGYTSLGAIASQLNAGHIQPPRGGKWHRMTVKRVLERVT
jgi:DNA invertase Pin-like site-specific DNA recombinase